MGKKKFKVPELFKASATKEKRLATLTDDERGRMAELQYAWEGSVIEMNAKDAQLMEYRQFIRTKYHLPRQYTIDLGTGEIFEPSVAPAPQPPVPLEPETQPVA